MCHVGTCCKESITSICEYSVINSGSTRIFNFFFLGGGGGVQVGGNVIFWGRWKINIIYSF